MQHISNTQQLRQNEFVEDKDLDFEIRKNPVICSRYFNHRVNAFQKMMLKNNTLFEKVSNFFSVTEFQNWGNEHVHFMLWLQDVPVFGHCNNTTLEDFIDKYISSDSTLLDPHLLKMKTHHHTKTCKKYKASNYRFSFPFSPMR